MRITNGPGAIGAGMFPVSFVTLEPAPMSMNPSADTPLTFLAHVEKVRVLAGIQCCSSHPDHDLYLSECRQSRERIQMGRLSKKRMDSLKALIAEQYRDLAA